MNSLNPSCVKVRIYYDRSSWHLLINKFISPFFTEQLNSGLIKYWYISLSKYMGEHIGIVVMPNENRSDVKATIASITKEFLLKHPSITKEKELPSENFFIDFPNNSIWFDKDIAPVKEFADDNLPLNQSITDAIINALAGDIIEDEDSYTFIIYLYLGAIKASDLSLSSVSNKIKKLLIENSPKYVEQTNRKSQEINDAEFYMELVLQNSDLLAEIFDDVWIENGESPDLLWLNKWIKTCKMLKNGLDFDDYFTLVCQTINKQLGLNNKEVFIQFSKIILTLIDNKMNIKIE